MGRQRQADRIADNWRPLFAIADLIGGQWPETARKVAVTLSGQTEADISVGGQLLADIHKIFDERGVERLSSEELCRALKEIEDRPWGDWKGWGLKKNQLADLVKPFGIRPRTVRVGEKTPRGYVYTDFEDAFDRYLPA